MFASRGGRLRCAFVLKGYPRLSETFIAQEIRALEERGLDIVIYSLRHPTDKAVHPVIREIRAPVVYLPEYLYREPWRVARAVLALRRHPRLKELLGLWWRDLRRDPTPNRVRRLGQALVLAHEIDPRIGRIHSHFLHTPGSVGRYAALLTALPWSCSAHAKDIWTLPAWEKCEKLAACDWLVTCTAFNADHLAALAPPGRVELVYHGLDLQRFPPPPKRESPPAGPLKLLSVGRAVAKKGYDDLLQALAALPADIDWHFTHIGGGPLRDALKRQAAGLGIGGRIDWRGPRTQAEVLAAYRAADLFVLASRITDDGDRDGLPNVLIEAQSQALPCIATAVSGIPELIRDGENGLLVTAGDIPALTAAILRLARDPGERQAMGRAGQKIVRENFDLQRCIARLAEKFALPAAEEKSAAEGESAAGAEARP